VTNLLHKALWFFTALSSFVGQGSVHAQPLSEVPGLELDWPVVEGCPGADEVERKVARLLVGQTKAAQTVRAHVEITPGVRFTLRLRTTTKLGVGERSLDADGCTQLAEATALILAMAIDPDAVERLSPPPSIPTEVLQPLVSSPRPSSAPTLAPRVPAGRVTRKLRSFEMASSSGVSGIAAGLSVATGIAPQPILGLEVAVDGRLSRASWYAEGSYAPVHRIALATDSERGVELSMWRLALGGGPRLELGRWSSRPRLGVAAEAASARGFGVDRPRQEWLAWWSLTAGHSLTFSLSKELSVQGGIELELAIHRPAAYLEPGGVGVRPDRLRAQAFLGGAGRF
jgi:hypothetical protein